MTEPLRHVLGDSDNADRLVAFATSRAAAVVGGVAPVRTTLLDAVAAVPGHRVLRVRTADGRCAAPFDGLADLMAQAGDGLDEIPEVQRAAIETVLGCRSGEYPESGAVVSLPVCVGVANVVEAAARDRDVLVVVDDHDAIDAPSRQVLSFVARRLADRRVVMLIGMADGAAAATALRLPSFRLTGLPPAELQSLGAALRLTVGAMARGSSEDVAADLLLRGRTDARAGCWVFAYSDLTEAARTADELGHPRTLSLALVELARLDAARGEFMLARRRLGRARRTIHGHGLDDLVVPLLAARGFLESTAGDLDTARETLEAARARATEGGPAGRVTAGLRADLVETYVRTRRRTAAIEMMSGPDESGTFEGHANSAALTARCRGMIADDPDEGEWWFSAASRHHDLCLMPFERARTALCAAGSLRRTRGFVAVRPRLREALSLFEGLGAQPWVARVKAELAASGVHAASRPAVQGLTHLTEQELRIAGAVADGMTNPEVAAALFISAKTVESNLTRVYRKLGLRSRTDLARVVPRRATADV